MKTCVSSWYQNSLCIESHILYAHILHVTLLIPSDGHHTLKVIISWSLSFIWWLLWFTTDSSKVSLLRRQSKVSSITSLLSPFSGNIWVNKFLFLSISSVMSLISLARDWCWRKHWQLHILERNQIYCQNHSQFCSEVVIF